jgi:sec-independent protein translocase protein TatC
MAHSAPAQTPPELPPEREPGEKYLTLMEHLAELRYRVIVSSLAVVAGLAVTAIFADDIIEYLQEPAKERSPQFQAQFIEPFENFVVYFKVALLGGLVLAMPVIVFQALRFVSPALRGRERLWLWGTVIGAFALFLSGVAFAYYIALPPAMDFLLNFNNDLASPNIRIGSYIDFVTRLLFWTGVCFQIPIVVMYLARFRIVRAGQLIHLWRQAIIAIAVIAAIVTPTIDPVTMSLVMAPMIVLYVLGIGLAFIVQPRNAAEPVR